MDLNRTPSEIATASAEELRQLNHRTLDPKAFPQPGDVSDTADAVARIVQYLPQALRQLEAGIEALHDEQRIRLDDVPADEVSSQEIQRRVFEVVSALREARVGLSRVDDELRRAKGLLGHMGAPWEDAEDNEG